MTATETNILFPGRPDYTGPTTGIFGLLHHDQLCERSNDVMERVRYVMREKPANEVAIRLHNMVYLGGCAAAEKLIALYAKYNADRAALYAKYAADCATLDAKYAADLAPLDAKYEADRAPLDAEIIAYIKQHIPDCAWNGKELVFP